MFALLLRVAVLIMSLGLATACSNVEPFEYTPANEMKPGPGLLSGEDGEFTLFSR